MNWKILAYYGDRIAEAEEYLLQDADEVTFGEWQQIYRLRT